ncbi:MAG: Cas8a1 family CRISPR/Cas system-associated protein [Candidatus Aenigmatarchaeota archaeon]|nr:hypothetical protein [Candidatus Aenigmarchaeota archaeon]
MPVSEAPYTRKYEHTKTRGRESIVTCGYCGRQVPRYKTFIKYSGMRISDPLILQQVDKSMIHLMKHKMYVCPSCARFHRIVQRGKTVRKKHLFK